MSTESEMQKADRLKLLEVRRAIYVRRARRALLIHLLKFEWATVDDVRAAVKLPAEIDSRYLGATPGPLVRLKIIEPHGYIRSERAEAHARPVQQWHLFDADAA